MARIPVSGVRTSCANVASAVSTMSGAAILAADLRAFPAAAFAARFFGGALLDRRLVRPGRDFDAMFPPTWPRDLPWHGRPRGVTLKRDPA